MIFIMLRQDLKKIKLRDSPGVYFFVGARGEILYIGKATSLKNRVRSYFSADIGERRGPAIARMVDEAKTVRYGKTDSVLEAFILEANLIRKYQPKYNVKEKDDKSFNYIVITKEDFPRVLLMRGRELLGTPTAKMEIGYALGPFPNGSLLREALKVIRKIFPFRDKCTPPKISRTSCISRKMRKIHTSNHSSILENTRMVKPCFNAQIGLCPGVCCGKINKAEYGAIIRNLALFLSGKKKVLLRKLEREMKAAAKRQEFEKAADLKRTLFALNHIQDISLIKRESAFLRDFASVPRGSAMRIEAYDVAHISGTAQVGVMVVIADGEPNKSAYRKFKIKTVRGADDTASLAEVLERRFGHPEWQYPRLIVVDGGKAQKNRAERVLKKLGIDIPTVSVVKDERHRPREILGLAQIYANRKTLMSANGKRELERSILLANAEAHRFAVSYHRRIRGILSR